MEQEIKTYHDYDDESVNADIKRRQADGWTVRQFEYSSQMMKDKLRSCVILLFERHKQVSNY